MKTKSHFKKTVINPGKYLRKIIKNL